MKHIVINIGRQFGSGGLAVARELGRKLNIPVYDVELINKAAQDSGFSENLFKENDETRHFFSLKTVFSGPFGRDYTSENELFKIQSETIKQIAGQGKRYKDLPALDLLCGFVNQRVGQAEDARIISSVTRNSYSMCS